MHPTITFSLSLSASLVWRVTPARIIQPTDP
jgi:hypothetical protein